jgi:uncharacterized protein (DUF983 family)
MINKNVNFRQSIFRGICRRCPNCGKGKLFAGYLKQVQICSNCNEELGHIRADDGPAWLTVLIVAHLLAPFILLVSLDESLPYWEVMLIAIIYISVLMLITLPIVKGFFIGIIWRLGCSGSEK